MVQAAHAAVKCKGTYLRAIYHRLVQRRGHKKAIIAIAHKILKAAYYILSKREPYQELGANYLHQHHSQQLLKRMCRRFSQLGYHVSLTPNP